VVQIPRNAGTFEPKRWYICRRNGGTFGPKYATSVDVVVKRNNGYWYYEIKTSKSPRACLREALGQLLEYSFWPGAQEANRLVVAGETAIDKEGEEYIKRLKERFSLPIEYEQISV